MTRFYIHLNHGTWKPTSVGGLVTVTVKGQVFTKESSVNTNEFGHFIVDSFSSVSPETRLREINGFYTWVMEKEDHITAAVDHVRTFPLFYGQSNGKFYLSDDAEWVRTQVNDLTMNSVAREEFQLTGCVTGSDTLFPNVKQLQAGEYLIAKETGNGIEILLQRYYRFLHREPLDYSEPALRAEMHQVTVASIQRLIDYANGRQIVVPLSGGYDSRLIVTLLKRFGYSNLLTFSYGVQGNSESVYSKQVANALGLRWHFVEYTDELWREAWGTDERWEYQKWASGWSSLSVVQDWLAVRELKNNHIVDQDCIFVPGHSGDFVAGSHIPESAFQKNHFKQEDVPKAIFHKHYSLAQLKISKRTMGFWHDMIMERCDSRKILAPWTFVDSFEKWDWQERQAKYICNSTRVYEFYGYDWWMPLWDKEFLSFWERVPLVLRKKREWHIHYVNNLFNKESSVPIDIGNAEEKMYGSTIKRILKRMVTRVHLINSYNQIKVFLPKKSAIPHLCWEAKYDYLDLDTLFRKGYTPTGVAAYDMLQTTNDYLNGKMASR